MRIEVPKRPRGRPRKEPDGPVVHIVVASDQVIRRGEAYTLAEFTRRTGLGDRAVRQMERAGLRTLMVARRKHVRGDDYLDYLDRLASEQRAADGC